MEYKVFIDASNSDFLNGIIEKEGNRIMFDIRKIGQNPFIEPDFVDRGFQGDVYGLLADQYVILYQVDHAVKRVYVLDITYVDQI